MWEKEKAFECNPIEGSTGTTDDKFIVTFPYPYSNGHLHLGHAFSLTKAVFRAQFERNRGKNSLFPFAFHCTGMPIQAVSRVYLLFITLCLCQISCNILTINYIIRLPTNSNLKSSNSVFRQSFQKKILKFVQRWKLS